MNVAMKKRPTIFDVAKLAEVSIKTVSRVINQEPNVQQSTRNRVLVAVDKLGYKPNAAARGLSGQRSYAIGLVYQDPQEFSYIKQVLSGALAACEAEGYSLLLRPITFPEDRLLETIRDFVRQSSLEGVVLPVPLADLSDVQALLQDLGVPIAQISPRQINSDLIQVFADDEEASYTVTTYLLEQGHKRVGFIKGIDSHGSTWLRLKGFRRALEEHQLELPPELVVPGEFDFESGRLAAGKLLDLVEPPTAIIASNDDMAAGVLFEAKERHVSVPENLSVVGFDDTPLAQRIWPPLTTVRQPIAEMVETAVSRLIKNISGGTFESRSSQFSCELVIRASTQAI